MTKLIEDNPRQDQMHQVTSIITSDVFETIVNNAQYVTM
jgi:hypothetical protein